MTKQPANKLKNSYLYLGFINFVVLFGLVGFAYTTIIIISSLNNIITRTDLRVDLPAFDGQDWPKKHFQELRDRPQRYLSYAGWIGRPYRSETINTEGKWGERVTIPRANELADSKPLIFFFGGSTTFGVGARDSETIPSFFAKISDLRVQNFGNPGYTAHQSIQLMLHLLRSGVRPDHIVFYDGANEVGVGCSRFFGVMTHSQQNIIREKLDQLRIKVENILLPFTDFAQRVSGRIGKSKYNADGRWGLRCDQNDEMAESVADNLIADWKLAEYISGTYEISFSAFLQPIHSVGSSVGNIPRYSSDGATIDNRRSVYSKIVKNLGSENYHDISLLLDGSGDVYIDSTHLAPRGNLLVATGIWRTLQPILKDKAPLRSDE
jgi:hypothetical protein